MKLAQRASGMSPSPTLAIDAKVKQMIADGIDIINFGVGEPDFDTPALIKDAAKKALDEGFTKYTPAGGILQLKKAIAGSLERDTGVAYDTSEIIVSCGAKHVLYNIFQVLCDPGDEVLVLSPYWVSYPEMVKLAGGRPVFIATKGENGFIPDIENVRKAITPKTKAIVINSPSNPTGAILPAEILRELLRLADTFGFYVVADEIYNRLVYGTKAVSAVSLAPAMKERIITVNGMSKTYAMTGWRIGYAAGDRFIIKAISDLQSHSTSNPTSIAQKAALAALAIPEVEPEVANMVAEFGRRRDILVERLQGIPGLHCILPQGAFYAFPNISSLFGRSYNSTVIDNSDTFADLLLDRARIAVVPGSGFGAPDHIRLSYATSLSNIEIGAARLAEFVSVLA